MKLYESFHKKTSSQNKLIKSNNFTYKIILPVLNEYIKPNSTILDFGSGSGVISLYLSQNAKEVTGVDISEKATKVSNESAKKLDVQNIKFINLEKYKFDKKYDYVLMLEVIEHIKNEDEILSKINRVLSKNGVLILSTPSQKSPLYRLKLSGKFDKKVGHIRRYSKERLQIILKDNGFKIIKIIPNEGILRNSLFIFKPLGFFIKFIKGPLVNFFTFIDFLSMKLLGESDYIVIAKKK